MPDRKTQLGTPSVAATQLMPPLLTARGLRKRYGSREVVRGVSIEVRPGEVLALLGPNGAGKTTTLEMILGLRRPDGGAVSFAVNEPRRITGVQLQTAPVFTGLSTVENLRVVASLYGRRLSRAAADAVLVAVGLGEVGNTLAVRLSGGQQKRLALAMALAHEPSLLVLDEPTAALDLSGQREVRTILRSLASKGVAVILTSHDIVAIRDTADRIVIVSHGVVVAEGTPDALLRDHGFDRLDDLFLALTTAPAN